MTQSAKSIVGKIKDRAESDVVERKSSNELSTEEKRAEQLAKLRGLSANIQSHDANFDPRLTMDKRGNLTLSGKKVPEGAKLLVNPFSPKHGDVGFNDDTKEFLGENMVAVTFPKPEATAGWKFQMSIQMRFLDEMDKQQVAFKGTSSGAISAISNLIEEIEKAAQGSENVVPIVTFVCGSYIHQKYGEILTPEFEIVDWISLDEMEALKDA